MAQSVVSFQSHVSCGYVGNSAAAFSLQCLGVEVWPVHTCQLSAHAGHPWARGSLHPLEEVTALVEGLRDGGILDGVQGVLSGYLSQAGMAQVVRQAVLAARPALFLCDPVMGDETAEGGGRLYTAPGIPQAVRTALVALAEVMPPNRFELSLLTGQPMGDIAATLAAARTLAALGPRWVVVTSLPLAGGRVGCLAFDANTDAAWVVGTPRLETLCPVQGGGDVVSALLLGHLLQGQPLPQALSLAVSALFAVLERGLTPPHGALPLVAAREALTAPPRLFAADPL